jgi:hypothetical protein
MKRAAMLMVLGATAMMLGCQGAAAPPGAPPPPTAPVSQDSATLTYALAGQTWCSNDQAAALVLLLMDGEDRYLSFSERQAALAARGVLASRWELAEDQPVTKGTLAYMVLKALDVKGGLMMRLCPSRRYAYREAVYRGMMNRGADYEPLTGPEAVAVFGRATAWAGPIAPGCCD